LPDFLWYNTPNRRGKYTERPQNIPNGLSKSQITAKYTK
jgi:hypothetical protein